MVNEEILGGLKASVERGESLGQAMQSFYNSGYKREEIEEAARVLQQQPKEHPRNIEPTPLVDPDLDRRRGQPAFRNIGRHKRLKEKSPPTGLAKLSRNKSGFSIPAKRLNGYEGVVK